MRWCFDAVTKNSAEIMGLEKYGVDVGNYADMVILQAKDPVEAIRLRPTRLTIIRRGKLIAQNTPSVSTLHLPDRPDELKPDDYAPE